MNRGERATTKRVDLLTTVQGRFYWCLARRRGKEEFGDTAASAADYNGYRLVNGDPSGWLPRVPCRLLGATGARALS